MRRIPKDHIKIIDDRPYFRRCAREAVFHDHTCRGRITIEHACGQLSEIWNYVPICEYAHSVGIYQDCGILDKRKNEFLALLKATPEDLAKYSLSGFEQKKSYLTKKYKEEIPPILEPPF